MKINIESQPSKTVLKALGVLSWPIWEKETSEFPWFYDAEEVCYILEGVVTVTPNGGQPVTLKVGDLVTLPAGMACRWDITQAIRKHYIFR